MQKGKQKLIADNRKDLMYSSGMSGPFSEDQQMEDDTDTPHTLKRKRPNKKPSNANIKCPHCGLMGHQRTSSAKCLKNKRFMEQERKLANIAREKGTYRV
jgi:hypothetical protein